MDTNTMDGQRVQGEKKQSAGKQTGLKQGTLGWVLLTGLGVSFVISGDFAGWQFGLVDGGWGGMAIALVVVGVLYLSMCMALAELSSRFPSAGGGHQFATIAFGRIGGVITASAIVLEYVVAPAAISTFIAAYVQSLGIVHFSHPWVIHLACYVIFVAINLAGAGEALKVMLVITTIASLALIAYTIAMVPHFDVTHLSQGIDFFPHGSMSVWLAIPSAIWFFLAVEGVPMAAEEARSPHRTLPRAILFSMVILSIFAFAMLLVGPGGAGTDVFAQSGDPLISGLRAIHAPSILIVAVNCAALIGLIASFFSITFGYSRLIYSLAREQILPHVFTRVNGRGVPTWALIVPAIIGFVLTIFIDGDTLMAVAVCGAVISYALMMASHIVLHKKVVPQQTSEDPYVTPGGRITSGIALVLSLCAIVCTFLANIAVGLCSVAVLACLLVLHLFSYRSH
ncbi:amino acid permease [Corynebacterium sp. sy039]|uniref:amino acid permease n=1 Tax=Corynebacterium sp. sy039 TaxID=2599641 RepID=UPI0011B61172|nr:amino acid permease [Corynebacterium sp. sy039]QDZ42865.1 amino acid permease [Corynebacterium sp. sy039]